LPIVILVDEISASASEIMAGAIQDNDRGTIIGRRTFGKGLVQVPIEFKDGSMLRLTRARYYTPSGRCVQKPYTPGDEDLYEQDLILRELHGEYYNQDSIKTSGEKYKTLLGRTVYGGGGIVPDVFVPRDTTGMTSYFKEAYMKGLIYQFAYAYTDENRSTLNKFKTVKELVTFLKKQDIVNKFVVFAEKNGLKRRNLLIKKSNSLLYDYLLSNIIDDILGIEASIIFVNETDPAMEQALQHLKRL
jgi:carboxyl-terminal processing protease